KSSNRAQPETRRPAAGVQAAIVSGHEDEKACELAHRRGFPGVSRVHELLLNKALIDEFFYVLPGPDLLADQMTREFLELVARQRRSLVPGKQDFSWYRLGSYYTIDTGNRAAPES
ncbi:hypothetical protein FRC12_019509, partial [Ceratobasidium sp. 428]